MIVSICPNPSIDCYARIDDFKPGEVNRFKKIEEFPGGKGVHVALALAELEVPSQLLGFWGGKAGEWIKNQCQKRNVQIGGMEIKGENRRCYTFISEEPHINHTEILGPGPILTKKNFTDFLKIINEHSFKVDLICMSGSWPNKGPINGYKNLIRIANNYQKKVILDCGGEQLKEAIKEDFFGIHINEHEAKELCGDNDINSLIKFLGDKVELIALSRGSKGLVLAYKNKIIKAKISLRSDEIFSTVGSGDCLTAGIIYALHKGLNIKEVAAWGVACGTANCINNDLGMLKKKDVERMLKRVKIESNE